MNDTWHNICFDLNRFFSPQVLCVYPGGGSASCIRWMDTSRKRAQDCRAFLHIVPVPVTVGKGRRRKGNESDDENDDGDGDGDGDDGDGDEGGPPSE